FPYKLLILLYDIIIKPKKRQAHFYKKIDNFRYLIKAIFTKSSNVDCPISTSCRAPCGARGLKHIRKDQRYMCEQVAPRAGRVD
ncbi:MAG: hypothetical protein WA081_23700, partial [Desulfosalsimonadaceae bacterium]